MATALFFANLAPNAPRAKLLEVLPANHKFGRRETMASWVQHGETPETWGYSFSVIYVSDREPEDLMYLKDPLYSFTMPDRDGTDWNEMLATGEMTRTFAQVEQYING